MSGTPTRRLELKYDITNLSVLYEESTVLWDNAEFTAGKDSTGALRLWEDGVEPEQIEEEWEILKYRVEGFRTALRYCGSHAVVFEQKGQLVYRYGDLKVGITDKSIMSSVPRPPQSQCSYPADMRCTITSSMYLLNPSDSVRSPISWSGDKYSS